MNRKNEYNRATKPVYNVRQSNEAGTKERKRNSKKEIYQTQNTSELADVN